MVLRALATPCRPLPCSRRYARRRLAVDELPSKRRVDDGETVAEVGLAHAGKEGGKYEADVDAQLPRMAVVRHGMADGCPGQPSPAPAGRDRDMETFQERARHLEAIEHCCREGAERPIGMEMRHRPDEM